jgi:hypothetical protein
MKLHLLLILSVSLILFGEANYAQKVLLLQKPGKTNWVMYNTGDKISVRLGEPEFAVNGVISGIDDSTCTINYNYTFQLSKVKEVTRTRHFASHSWRTLYLASVLYFAGSMFNHGINSEKPLIDNTVPIVSGSLAALGSTALLLRYRHCKMENGWCLKVLDFDIYKEKYQPEK